MTEALTQVREDVREVLSEIRPDLVSEFDSITTPSDDPRWMANFLDKHFPDQSWRSVEPTDTARLLLGYKTIEQRAVAAVVQARRRNPHLFGNLR